MHVAKRLVDEAICRDSYYATRLAAGVETAWQQNPQMRQRVILVVNPSSGNRDSWLAGKPWGRAALGICTITTTAAHNSLAGDSADAVNAVRRLVDELRTRG